MKEKPDRIERLIAYLQGELDNTAREEFEGMMAEDAELQEVYYLVKDLQQQAKEIDWSQIRGPINEIASRLVDDFLVAKRSTTGQRGVLVYDSKHLPLPTGVRPAATDTRKMRYKFGIGELDISVYPVSPDSYEMIGQITGKLPEKKVEVVLKSGQSVHSTMSDRFLLFRFARIQKKTYELFVKSNGDTIVSVTVDL